MGAVLGDVEVAREGAAPDGAQIDLDGRVGGGPEGGGDPAGVDWLPVSTVRAEFATGEEPPYRLRVQFVNEGLPRSREELMKSAEAQVRPWVRRELPSSS